MLHGYSTNGARFYSYGGTQVAQTRGVFGDERINADGQLFYPVVTYTSSGRSVSVAMYHPGQDKALWTRLASTQGANVNGMAIYPLPDGGVVALIQSRRWPLMVCLPRRGIRLHHRDDQLCWPEGAGGYLPNTGANDLTYYNTWGATRVATDTSAKLGVVRDASMTVATASGSTADVPAVAVGVLDPYSGTWTYQTLMTGDALKPGGPTGYSFRKGPWFTNNTLLFMASCSGNCTDRITRLYPVKVAGLGRDYPQGTVLTKAPRPSSEYIALGDSFSSGEGVEPFEADTALPMVNICHRSEDAYARLVATSTGLSLGTNGSRFSL